MSDQYKAPAGRAEPASGQQGGLGTKEKHLSITVVVTGGRKKQISLISFRKKQE